MQIKSQSGRSMVEMLGVLAVMGLLSVVGVMGFRDVLNKQKATETINQLSKRALWISSNRTLMAKLTTDLTQEGFSETDGFFTISNSPSYTDNTFSLRVYQIPKEVCQHISEYNWKIATITQGLPCENTTDMVFRFNNDLSERTQNNICDINEPLSTCICPENRTTTDGKCGLCTRYIEKNWTQPILTSKTSYGILTSTPAQGGQEKCVPSNHPVFCAFDNIVAINSKYYAPKVNSAFIQWQLPVKLKVSSVDIYTSPEPTVLNRFPNTIVLSGSNDGSTWTELTTATNYTKPESGKKITLTVNSDSPYQYLKWTFQNDDISQIAIAEITVFADEVVTEYYPPDNTTLQCP